MLLCREPSPATELPPAAAPSAASGLEPACTPRCSTSSALAICGGVARARHGPLHRRPRRQLRRLPLGRARGAAGAVLHGAHRLPAPGRHADPAVVRAGTSSTRRSSAGDSPPTAGWASCARSPSCAARSSRRLPGWPPSGPPPTRPATSSGWRRRCGPLGKAGDEEAFLALDIEFHRRVLAASGNEMFAQAQRARRRGADRPAPLRPDAPPPARGGAAAARRRRPGDPAPRRRAGPRGDGRIMEQALTR